MTEENGEKSSKNVIILWNYLNWGGAQIYFLSIVKHAPKDWKFKIVVPKKSPPDIIELFKKNGAKIEFRDVLLDSSPANSVSKKIKRQWSRIHSEISTYYYIKGLKLKNTVLHVETAPWQSWIFIKKLSEKINVFVTMHNSMPATSNWREKIWSYRMRYVSKLKTFHLFTSNQDTKNSLKKWVTEEFWERINVTYTCVDPSEIEDVLNSDITKTSIREKFSIPVDAFVVLSVGQFIDRKGRIDFLKAAKNLAAENDKIKFIWLTQTELTKADFDLIEGFDLGNSFELFESKKIGKERMDVLRFFLTADVFALPSYVEGLPIALLEAMALGIPSISTNINAIPEAIIDHQTGLLIEAGDSSGLIKAVRELKNDTVLSEKLSRQGREFVIQKFDERVCARIVLDNYREALDNER